MKIAIDVSSVQGDQISQNAVRGVGSYIENLKQTLVTNFPDNNYTFFVSESEIPKDADIVHYPYFDPFFITRPIFNSRNTIITIHDLIPIVFPKHFPSGFRRRLVWEIQKRLLSRIDAIITDSELSKDDIRKYTGVKTNKIHVVYLAAAQHFKKVNVKPEQKESILKKYSLPDKFVIYVGDATWNKNLSRLVRAVEKIDVPLVMVGKALKDQSVDLNHPWNTELAEVRNLVKGSDRIKTLGFIPADDLVLLYNLATLCVVPSIYEGFCLPVLEAMNCGCPVVTTKGGSIAEVANNAVFFVDPYSIDDIASGIKYVFFSQEEQKKLSNRGLKQALEFSWDKTALETLNVYKHVLHKNKKTV